MGTKSALIVETDDLDEDEIEEVRAAVDAVLAKFRMPIQDPTAVQGWTVAGAVELDRRLRAENRPVQADTIAWAAHHGAYTKRSEVKALGNYSETRSLSGFTKPVNRLVAKMIREGLVSQEAANPMKTDYDPANPSYQQARGFSMPTDVASVFAQALVSPSLPKA